MVPLVGVEGRITAAETGPVGLQVIAVLASVALNQRIVDELASGAVEINQACFAFAIENIGVETTRALADAHFDVLVLERAVGPTGSAVLCVLACALLAGFIALATDGVGRVGVVA